MRMQLLIGSTLALLSGAAFADNVGVSIGINTPGIYGQINIGGGAPPPAIIYQQPMVIAAEPAYESAPPIYLHVPPGHEKHWRKHCREYNACGRPVYFVRDDWYARNYPHGHRGHDREDEDRDHGHGHGHDRDHEDRDH